MLKDEGWDYCALCDAITYNTQCECYSTICNAGGCEKCKDELKEALIAIEQGRVSFYHIFQKYKKLKDEYFDLFLKGETNNG